MSIHAALLAACLGTAGSGSEPPATKTPQIRAIWVARWDITSPEDCRTLVRLAKQYGFNTLVVQVRGRGDALYKSAYEPRCEFLKDQPPDFDPLGTILEEAKPAGIAVHAWINANYTWDSETPPSSPEHIVNKHPDWLMRDEGNRLVMKAGEDVEGAYTCPSNDEFRDFLKNVYLDVATHYDVDGVHFDFIRYPSPRFCYCDRCLRLFQERMDERITPERRKELANTQDRLAYTRAFPREWDKFRREQITKLVYCIYDAVKAAQPKMIVSAAVFPDYSDAFSRRFQDWKKWLKDDKLDMLFPMSYVKSTERLAELVEDAIRSSSGKPVVAGIGAWQITPEDAVDQITKASELGAVGYCLFSYSITKKGTQTDYLRKVSEAYPKDR
ncbi:MAG: family 10 glycosylhydrolase [Armatimonadota bacterium]|nr:family 10 glycosylhydrolase [Armatimonadota bacterium]